VIKVIQIVRNFTQYGGMENYVWHLSHELLDLGYRVVIICLSSEEHYDKRIKVIKIKQSFKFRSSWKKHLVFSYKLRKIFSKKHYLKKYVIHSHERVSIQDLSTIHGPLIKDRKRSIFDFLSPRLTAWKFLEKREFNSPNLVCIFPNSIESYNKFNFFYKNVNAAVCKPAYPGVDESFYSIENKENILNIGFIGKEWKRKGLPFAVNFYKKILSENNKLHFYVAGPDPDEIKHLFSDISTNRYTLLGWSNSFDFFRKIDLLIHPALNEPFGMVSAEANASGVYQFVSNHTGFKEFINPRTGKILPLDESKWVEEFKKILNNHIKVERIFFSWKQLALSHSLIYKMISKTKKTIF